MSPLMFAAYQDNAEAALLLIAAKADVARQDTSGRTALMHGAVASAGEACKVLIA